MRGAIPRAQKISISPQFRAIDPPNLTRGFIQQNQNVRLATTACHPKFQNARFATAACAKMYESSARLPRQPAPYKNHHFTTISDVRPTRGDERVAPSKSKFAFHHSFGRPMSTKRRKGRERTPADSHFTTVLDVRHARSDEMVVCRRCQPNPPGVKRRKKFLKKSSSFRSAAFIHSHSQQPLSAASLSSHFQQPFSAATLSSSFQQLFSAAIISRSSQQPVSAATFSSHSQQPLSAALFSSSSQQPLSADLLSSQSQQPLSAAILGYHLAVVRGWWSAIVISDYHHVAVVSGWWSAIISSCCCGQGLVVSYYLIMLLWSGVGGQLLSHHVAVVRGWWSAIESSSYCGQLLVVNCAHIL